MNVFCQPDLHSIQYSLESCMFLRSKVLKSGLYLDHRILRQQHQRILEDFEDLRWERLLEPRGQGVVESWHVGADDDGPDGCQPQALTNLAEEDRRRRRLSDLVLRHGVLNDDDRERQAGADTDAKRCKSQQHIQQARMNVQ